MDQQINYTDILKKSFVKLSDFGDISLADMSIGLVMSLFLGLFIFYIYKRSFRGVVYSHTFNITLVMGTMVTALIIMTISSNIVLSLGMVGALSIVRFRTAIKDPLDVTHMFWAIAAGIAVGAKMYLLAVVGCLVIGIVVNKLSQFKFKDQTYLLIVHFQENVYDAVKYYINKQQHTLKSKVVKNDSVEMTVELKLNGENTMFVNDIASIEGVLDAALVSYDGDYAF